MEYVKKLRGEGHPQAQLFSMAGAKWGELTDEEKEPYVKKNLDDKKRHADQKAELAKKGYFTMTDGSKSTDEANAHLFKEKKKRVKKETKNDAKKAKTDASDSDDEDEEEEQKHPPPKRALSAWTLFLTLESAKLRKEGKAQGEAFKICGEMWGKMTDAEKEPHTKENERLKEIADDQKKELAKHGYYTLANGSKSTDPQNSELLKIKKKKTKKPKEDEKEEEKVKLKSKHKEKAKARAIKETKASSKENQLDLIDDDSD